MDQVISVVIMGVAFLVDAISKDPKFFLLMAGFFVFGPYIPEFLFGDFAKKEEEALLDQIRQELEDLKGHIDTRLDSFEESLRNLLNSLP